MGSTPHALQVGEQNLPTYSVTKKSCELFRKFRDMLGELLSTFLAVRKIYFEGKKDQKRIDQELMYYNSPEVA